jgi:hypothetical protein
LRGASCELAALSRAGHLPNFALLAQRKSGGLRIHAPRFDSWTGLMALVVVVGNQSLASVTRTSATTILDSG